MKNKQTNRQPPHPPPEKQTKGNIPLVKTETYTMFSIKKKKKRETWGLKPVASYIKHSKFYIRLQIAELVKGFMTASITKSMQLYFIL